MHSCITKQNQFHILSQQNPTERVQPGLLLRYYASNSRPGLQGDLREVRTDGERTDLLQDGLQHVLRLRT